MYEEYDEITVEVSYLTCDFAALLLYFRYIIRFIIVMILLCLQLMDSMSSMSSRRRELQADIARLHQELNATHARITNSPRYSQEHTLLFEQVGRGGEGCLVLGRVRVIHCCCFSSGLSAFSEG